MTNSLLFKRRELNILVAIYAQIEWSTKWGERGKPIRKMSREHLEADTFNALKYTNHNENNGQCFTFLLLVNRYQTKVKHPKDICSKSSLFPCETHKIPRWTPPSMPYPTTFHYDFTSTTTTTTLWPHSRIQGWRLHNDRTGCFF